MIIAAKSKLIYRSSANSAVTIAVMMIIPGEKRQARQLIVDVSLSLRSIFKRCEEGIMNPERIH